MKFSAHNRQVLSGAIIFFYLIPFLFLASYSIGMMSRNKSWLVLSLGLLLIATGSLILILLLSYWEKALKRHLQPQHGSSIPFSDEEKEPKVTSLNVDHFAQEHPLTEYENPSKSSSQELSLLEGLNDAQLQNHNLLEEIDNINQAAQLYVEESKLSNTRAEKATQDLEDYKLFSEEQLKQKHLQITTLQQMMDDQRSEMEKRQDQIQLLDTKIHDLSYEIKTLLHLNEIDPQPIYTGFSNDSKMETPRQVLHDINEEAEASLFATAVMTEEMGEQEVRFDHPIKMPSEAVALLRKCVSGAQKLIGANYNSPEAFRYRELSSSHYTIDQRRLFDNLRSETSALIIVYSPKDNKVLFANQASKIILGWSPDKLASDFALITQEGMTYWKKALSLLSSTPESQARLLAKSKQGQEILLNCHLGSIPSGLFRGYVIGVLYPTQ